MIFRESVSKHLHFQDFQNLPHFFPRYMDTHPRVLHTKQNLRPLYFKHLKYEPDLSTYAGDKWGVKIVMACGTPCNWWQPRPGWPRRPGRPPNGLSSIYMKLWCHNSVHISQSFPGSKILYLPYPYFLRPQKWIPLISGAQRARW